MRYLKSNFALALAFVLIMMTCAASAENLPYMEQLSQDRYVNTTFLPTECYPEICISPYYFDLSYIKPSYQPWYVRFPCPEDTLVTEFDERSCSFIDMDYSRQYFYEMHDSAAFETFVDNAEKDEYILADGSSGNAAIYIDPTRCRANAMIGVKEIDRTVKLRIVLYDSSLQNKSEQEIIDGLTAQIVAEVARVQSSMRVELMEHYWSEGCFAGYKQICEVSGVDRLIMTCTLPEEYFIVRMNYYSVTLAAIKGENNVMFPTITLDTNSNTIDYGEAENISSAVVEGEEYRVYARPSQYDTGFLSCAADRVIADNVGLQRDDTLRLFIDLFSHSSNIYEPDLDHLLKDLTEIVSCLSFDYGQTFKDYHDVPTYTGTVVTNMPAETPQASSETWTCESCGSENSGGKFCSNCGSPRPEESTALICTNCGYVVPAGETPNFCSNCGNPF